MYLHTPLMEATEIIQLFDSCWFEKQIFKSSNSDSFSEVLDHQNPEKATKPEISRAPTIITRSMSDPKTSFASGFSFSPDSVLHTPKLHTILSGKEIKDDENSTSAPEESSVLVLVHVKDQSPKKKVSSRRRGKKTASKSLSELEYEELKGFMDLGFVFSEKDKDSKLVSIIPGLQRLGKKDGEEERSVDESAVARPYLSEAWEVLDRRRKEEPLMEWRIPALNNEIDMKSNLKSWAHTVASTVR